VSQAVASPVRPDILYVVHRFPYPPDKGDRIRAFHVLRFLSKRANVHLATLADEQVAPKTLDALQELCARVAVVPVGHMRWPRALISLGLGRSATEGAFCSRRLRRLISQWSRETHFHASLASSSSVAPYLKMPSLAGVPAVVDLVDVDSQKWFDYSAVSRWPKSWLYALEGSRLRRFERDLPHWARAVTVVSEAEAALYRSFGAPKAVHVIPNGVDLNYFRPQPVDEEQSCVFVGALDYRPNIDGACWFCREAWPEIRLVRPAARLYLVGRRPAPEVLELAQVPGVKVVGQVPDVRPYVARSAVVVVPLRLARGVQNKVLEALAMAKATIASPQALAGVRLRDGFHLLQAGDKKAWVSGVLRLLAKSELRVKLGRAGRCFVEIHHSWERCLKPLARLLGLPTADAVDADASATQAADREQQLRDGIIADARPPGSARRAS
jgi:sugar transferase (PEP-CTERM/EpsH1 system associated)